MVKAVDLKYREDVEKLKEIDPRHPHCPNCGSRNVTTHDKEGFALILVVRCKECRKTFWKVVEKKLTKSRRSSKEDA